MATKSVATGLTARAGGGVDSATALTAEYNVIATCATDGDSAILPAITIGMAITVKNDGVAYCSVFPPGASVEDESGATAYKVQPGQEVTFTPVSSTKYKVDNPATETVSQATSITTGVTLDAVRGVITTQAASAAADAAHTFSVADRFARASSNISVNLLNYSGTIGTNGNPNVLIDNQSNGAFDIIIYNAHGANALSGTLKIGFDIKN